MASDFGTTSDSLEAWDRYKESLGEVLTVLVTHAGIAGLPVAEDMLATFVALGSTGSALALSGTNCGYGGEGPHGTVAILRDLGIGENLARLVYDHLDLRYQRLEDRWLVEIGPDR